MKKLTVLLVVIILVAGLLTGCWVLPESKLISICVDPKSMSLEPGETEPIISVTANYNDGTSEDIELTDCEYLSGDLEIATVNIEGLVTAKSIGDIEILVTYTQHNLWTGRVTITDIVDVFVEELNKAPIITSDPITYYEIKIGGKDYFYDVDATDPDGDVLTYSLIVSPTATKPDYVMTIDSVTGVINWKPWLEHIGLTNNVTVEVTDGDLSDTQSFSILVSWK